MSLNSFSVGLVSKNESKYLSEWIKYYRWLGCDEIFICLHSCSDDSYDVIRSSDQDITIIVETSPEIGWEIKNDLYLNMVQQSKTDWMFIPDIDEFLYTPNSSIKDYLKKIPSSISAIAIYQNIFGFNGHVKSPEGSVIKNYTKRNADDITVSKKYPKFDVPQDLIKNIKPIFRRSHVQKINTSHVYDFSGYLVNEDYSLFSYHKCDRMLNNIRINHYFTKSREDWDWKTSRQRFSKCKPYGDEWFKYCEELNFEDTELSEKVKHII